jgi:uncharacterized protein with ATP-grasp and redox domains
VKTYIDCIPCILRQTIEAARLFSGDLSVHNKILKEALIWCANMDMSLPAPVMGRRIHERLRKLTGIKDPYRLAKAKQNRMALRLLEELRPIVLKKADSFGIAARLAIAGNTIDMGAENGETKLNEIRKSLLKALKDPIIGDIKAFKKAADKASRIFYIADNAGEIVFDRFFIENLGPKKVILGVRGKPILNDALIADARFAALNQLVKIVDSGLDVPGTLIGEVKPEFARAFKNSDMVIAKGQGNYETLSESPRKVYFLFKAKCLTIARHAGVRLGDNVLISGGGNT